MYFFKPGGNPWNWILKVLKSKNEIIPANRAQRLDEKNGLICLVIIFTLEVKVIKMSKVAHFFIFCWWRQKIIHSLGNLFKCIWKVFSSSFRKRYELLDSKLSRCCPLKIQGFGFFLTQQFSLTSTLNISQTVTSKPINHTIFWRNSKRFFRWTYIDGLP